MTDRVISNISRRAVLGGLVAGVGQSAFAGAPVSSLRPIARSTGSQIASVPGLNELVTRAGLGGKISLVVADASTGRILESLNPVLGLPPASVAKVITSQYALEALGPAHSFSTRLVGTGSLTNGRLNGDLVLVGGGDPTLDTNGLAEMAAALKSAGVREVTGRFLVHGGALPHINQIDSGQPEHLGYNPAISGLNLNYNRIHFEWKRAGDAFSVSMDARSERYRPDIAMTQMKIVERKTPVYTYKNGGRTESWTVARAALGNGGSRWLPVRQPELYAGEVLQIFARSHGINLRRAEMASGVVRGSVLVNRQSPPLSRILQGMLRHSTNLTAEVSGLSASVARGRSVDTLAQSAGEMSRWMKTRLGARKPRFVDHSGLGDKTRVSASDMVAAMVRIGPNSTLGAILKTIEMRDGEGDLLGGSNAKLKAKTGTLNFVSGLSGFVSTGARKDLAFAIFAADMPRRNGIRPADRERPPGAKGWTRRARALQWGLINRWVALYG